MTPAIRVAQRAGIKFTIHEYVHDESVESFGLEAASKLGVDPRRVLKTLVAKTEMNELVIGIVPVMAHLNLKRLAAESGAKKILMADSSAAERATGYVVGGISPLGGRKHLRIFLDSSVSQFETIFVSAGRRGLELELSPNDLIELTRGITAEIATT